MLLEAIQCSTVHGHKFNMMVITFLSSTITHHMTENDSELF